MTLGGGQVKESADVSYISHSLTLPCLPPVSSQHTTANRGFIGPMCTSLGPRPC